ncbi:MerR family transcriptional regulator [Opitutus terrae]|uniref:Transcriptional regulator, MerR family n=1 Tax=Opitutus terrae (strain DSM 11246 / JCM 15787 / PB90-1) TaxID=452637 RepID=B1ZYX1_OPITP|nr:MerR family transcriptional regulator [Opitutus terrae]ACB76294.1 transcriptional regulator, MerR family [Opitutus terrae PB90-1]
MKTITVIARQFGLSRSTLLYYDRIGLLSPSYRTHAEARLYSAADEARLARIVTFREAGIPLETIKTILAAPLPAKVNRALESRLREIQQQIDGCRGQQRFIVELLKEAVLRGEGPARTRDQWVELLHACAFSEADMQAWHADMERKNPAGHARFLRKIGLSAVEIERVQVLSRTAWAPAGQLAASASSARPKRRL